MFDPLNNPLLMLLIGFAVLSLSAWLGAALRKRWLESRQDARDDLALVIGAALTLLGLIIGFTFSMAVNRYDQRKDCEEAEANAIGTEYLRADFLAASDAAMVRDLLRKYLDQRILEYRSTEAKDQRKLELQTAQLQAQLWSQTRSAASSQPTAVMTLVASGMNDVLNAQGYTQASWRNRIPRAAWALLVTISILCNFLIGYSAHGRGALQFLVLPIVLSISLYLIAEIDSPRRGLIRVPPQNLASLAESLHTSSP